jgi:hypothetical protein
MSALQLTQRRANAVGWLGSALLMALLFALLSVLVIERPRRVEPPPSATLNWVRQVYQVPTRVERVRHSLRARALREVPDLRLRPEDLSARVPLLSRPELDSRSLPREPERRPLVDGRGPGRPEAQGGLSLPERRLDGRERGAAELPRIEPERLPVRSESSMPAGGTPRVRLLAWAAAQAPRELDADLAAFSGCRGGLPAGRMLLEGRAWQAWLCAGDPLRLLLLDGREAALLVLVGEELELQSLRLADRFAERSDAGLLARYASGDEGGLRRALLQYLEELR